MKIYPDNRLFFSSINSNVKLKRSSLFYIFCAIWRSVVIQEHVCDANIYSHACTWFLEFWIKIKKCNLSLKTEIILVQNVIESCKKIELYYNDLLNIFLKLLKSLSLLICPITHC